MDKEIEYEEVTVTVDGTDYTVDFIACETWDWVDHGIGPYEYWGAFGIDEKWEWELANVEVMDVYLHEYNDGQLIGKSSIDNCKKEFSIKLIKACIDYANNEADEPKENGDYYNCPDPSTYDSDYDDYDNYYDPEYYPSREDCY